MSSDDAAWRALLIYLAGEEGDPAAAYELMRRRLTGMFRARGACGAEDLADEAFDRVARRLLGGAVDVPPHAYFLGVARNLLHEHWRRRSRESAEELPPVASPPAAEPDGALECLEAGLAALTEEERAMLIGYYTGTGQAKIDRRRLLAEEQGISPTALRMRMCRRRAELERDILDCLGRANGDGSARGDIEDRDR